MELEYGKFKGRQIKDPFVPTSYLQWIHDKLKEDVAGLADELARRKQIEREDRQVVEEIIDAGFAALIADGGNEEELRGGREALLDTVREYFWQHGPEGLAARRELRYHVRGNQATRENIERANKIMRDKRASKEARGWAEAVLAGEEEVG